jgi:hypothetical protein
MYSLTAVTYKLMQQTIRMHLFDPPMYMRPIRNSYFFRIAIYFEVNDTENENKIPVGLYFVQFLLLCAQLKTYLCGAISNQNPKPIVVFIHTTWCVPTQMMENNV